VPAEGIDERGDGELRVWAFSTLQPTTSLLQRSMTVARYTNLSWNLRYVKSDTQAMPRLAGNGMASSRFW